MRQVEEDKWDQLMVELVTLREVNQRALGLLEQYKPMVGVNGQREIRAWQDMMGVRNGMVQKVSTGKAG